MSILYYKHKTEQTMWAKYNCWEQMGVSIFMLGQEASTPIGQMGALRTQALQKHMSDCGFDIPAQRRYPDILWSFINTSINAILTK